MKSLETNSLSAFLVMKHHRPASCVSKVGLCLIFGHSIHYLTMETKWFVVTVVISGWINSVNYAVNKASFVWKICHYTCYKKACVATGMITWNYFSVHASLV